MERESVGTNKRASLMHRYKHIRDDSVTWPPDSTNLYSHLLIHSYSLLLSRTKFRSIGAQESTISTPRLGRALGMGQERENCGNGNYTSNLSSYVTNIWLYLNTRKVKVNDLGRLE